MKPCGGIARKHGRVTRSSRQSGRDEPPPRSLKGQGSLLRIVKLDATANSATDSASGRLKVFQTPGDVETEWPTVLEGWLVE